MSESPAVPAVDPADIDRRPVFGSAAFLYAIAVMPGAVAPGFVAAAAHGLHLSESQLGLLFSLFFAGFGIVGASAYLWIRKVDWRRISFVGVTLMALSFLAMAWTTSVPAVLGLMFLNGVGAGLFGSPSITVLGDMSRPERGFSAMIMFSVVGAAILLALYPLVETEAGFPGVSFLSAGTTLICLALLPWIPRNNTVSAASAHGPASTPVSSDREAHLVSQPLYSLIVMVLFNLGFIGMWTFFERVAFHAQLSALATSRALAIGTLFGTLGAPLTAYARRRMPMHYCYAIVAAGIVVTLAILEYSSLSELRYLLLTCSFQFWINAGFCIIMALTAEVDKVGRYVALIPAAQSLGAFSGPLVTGLALEYSGVATMIALTIASFVLSALLFAYVDRRDLAAARRAASG